MNEVARWIALQDRAYAVPLKGAAGRITEEFGLSASEAGNLLEMGIRTGAIALQDADTGAVWMPSPRAMATQIDWALGWLVLADQPLKMLVIHWPDVERIARTKNSGLTIEGVSDAAQALSPPVGPSRKRPGPKGDATKRAAAAMLAHLRDGKATLTSLQAMKQESLAAAYGVASRSTAIAALTQAVSQFNSDSISGK